MVIRIVSKNSISHDDFKEEKTQEMMDEKLGAVYHLSIQIKRDTNTS